MIVARLGPPAGAAILLSLFMLQAVPVTAGPVFDPFLEEFQVGSYLDPDRQDMAGIWPGGLLRPLEVDPRWVEAACELLAHPDRHPGALTIRFAACLADSLFGGMAAMAQAVADLGPEGVLGPVADPAGGFLRSERWAVNVFRLQDSGRAGAAAALVRLGLRDGQLSLSDRQRFVWELRARYLDHLAGQQTVPLERPWPPDNDLGPYDQATVWALWTAHRRAAGLPLLPGDFTGRQEAERLAGLGQHHLTPRDLDLSGFDEPTRAGLGATLFEGADLAAHLARHPTPPADFSLQGWWVKGQRFSRRGNADHYEALAARPDLSAGWRLDILRRASELRLLDGQWDAGLRDLEQALALARDQGGTVALRRRLRQWVEQAAVLALAQGRPQTAWDLLDRGDASFFGEAGEVFRQETRHWRDLRAGTPAVAADPVEDAALRVAAGLAGDLTSAEGAAGVARKEALIRAAEAPLDSLWLRWGMALADPASLSGDTRTRALAYRAVLEEALASGDADTLAAAPLRAAALRFRGRPEILEPFLSGFVDQDAGRLSGWVTAPRPSPVPGLLPVLRKSQLDMHAALGLALAAGDLRGIVGLAHELPGSGLTNDEKRRFLYPLPGDGPIRKALLEAANEPALILAVARNESLFEPAVRSRAGALGWMQIMPFHFPGRGALAGQENWAVPSVSIRLGDNLLSESRRRYGGDPYLVLAAYNAGPQAAERWRRQLGGSPARDIYLAWIGYIETRNYVEKVLIDREIYDWILAGRPGE